MSDFIYQMVTDRILNHLEKGTVPWRRPWNKGGLAVNWVTQKPYSGNNSFILEPGEYASFKQVKDAGGRVKKNAKGHVIVFYKLLPVTDEETEEKKIIPFLRYSRVYDILNQCEGLDSRRRDEVFAHDPIIESELIIQGYKDRPSLNFASGRAFYSPLRDEISVPPIHDYKIAEEYYSTIFHEMIHSTGHKNRLNRKSIVEFTKFGDELYSKEELVAELGAAMLCAKCGIDNSTIENSASYIGGWLRALKNDPKLFLQAASLAKKGVKYILGLSAEQELDSDTDGNEDVA